VIARFGHGGLWELTRILALDANSTLHVSAQDVPERARVGNVHSYRNWGDMIALTEAEGAVSIPNTTAVECQVLLGLVGELWGYPYFQSRLPEPAPDQRPSRILDDHLPKFFQCKVTQASRGRGVSFIPEIRYGHLLLARVDHGRVRVVCSRIGRAWRPWKFVLFSAHPHGIFIVEIIQNGRARRPISKPPE
jgi:hypothetical protein